MKPEDPIAEQEASFQPIFIVSNKCSVIHKVLKKKKKNRSAISLKAWQKFTDTGH